jgi:hypothetical protein
MIKLLDILNESISPIKVGDNVEYPELEIQSKVTKVVGDEVEIEDPMGGKMMVSVKSIKKLGNEKELAEKKKKNKLDKVGEEDNDPDNDGKKNTKADKYILNRRKAIAANLKEGDHEVAMAVSSLEEIAKAIIELRQKLGNTERNIPGWIQDHIAKAENYIEQAAQGFHELKNDE